MNKNNILTNRQREWAYTKWCEGYTLYQIADALNVCTKTVSRAIGSRERIRPVLRYEE